MHNASTTGNSYVAAILRRHSTGDSSGTYDVQYEIDGSIGEFLTPATHGLLPMPNLDLPSKGKKIAVKKNKVRHACNPAPNDTTTTVRVCAVYSRGRCEKSTLINVSVFVSALPCKLMIRTCCCCCCLCPCRCWRKKQQLMTGESTGLRKMANYLLSSGLYHKRTNAKAVQKAWGLRCVLLLRLHYQRSSAEQVCKARIVRNMQGAKVHSIRETNWLVRPDPA